MEALKVIEENVDNLLLPDIELRGLGRLKGFLSAAPEEAPLTEDSLKKF